MRKLALLYFVLASSLLAAAQFKLDKAAPFSDAAAPAKVREALDPAGLRVLQSDGNVFCDIWLRKSLPAATPAPADDIAYPDFAPGAMIGVISLPGGAKDFRGQPVKPGVYTLRYVLIPLDGNHLGVSPNRDFLLLVPLASDPDPVARLDPQQVINLSKAVIGTNHPSPWSLLPPDKGDTPRLFENADGFQVLAATLRLDSGKSVTFSLVVKGQAQQ